eukprot:238759-Amphidinium_carterae.2
MPRLTFHRNPRFPQASRSSHSTRGARVEKQKMLVEPCLSGAAQSTFDHRRMPEGASSRSTALSVMMC